LLSSWLLVLALGATLAAGFIGGPSAGRTADVKTDLLREALRLKRIARSVRRDDVVAAEDEAAAVPGELYAGPLAGLAFAQGLAGADLPLTEVDEMLLQSRGGAGLHEVTVPRGPLTLQRALSRFPSGGKASFSVVALRRREGPFLHDPPPELKLRKGDVLLVLGRARDAAALRRSLA
jgi:hypothetical protein